MYHMHMTAFVIIHHVGDMLVEEKRLAYIGIKQTVMMRIVDAYLSISYIHYIPPAMLMFRLFIPR